MNLVLGSDKSKNIFGSLVFVVFTFIALYKFSTRLELFFLLLVVREALAAYYLFTRLPSTNKIPIWQSIIAYTSSAMPLLYFSADTNLSEGVLVTGRILMIAGFALSTLALIDLGKSFGISPKKRGMVVKSGVYKILRHPMYLGYVFMEIGILSMNLEKNVFIFMTSCFLYLTRVFMEELVLINEN